MHFSLGIIVHWRTGNDTSAIQQGQVHHQWTQFQSVNMSTHAQAHMTKSGIPYQDYPHPTYRRPKYHNMSKSPLQYYVLLVSLALTALRSHSHTLIA